MAISFAHHDFTHTSHRCHHMTRFDRKDLVTVTMEQQQWFATKSGRDFASRRLRSERDHTSHFVHHHTDSNRDSSAERMTHHDDASRARVGDQLNGRGDIETTRVEIVRPSVRHANDGNSPRRP